MREYMSRHRVSLAAAAVLATVGAGSWSLYADRNPSLARGSAFVRFSAPAGDRPATANTTSLRDACALASIAANPALVPAFATTSM